MQHSNTAGCILLKFYIKPQPSFSGSCLALCCILSKFHIKPQPTATMSSHRFVVSYRNSTSNHNNISCRLFQIPVVSYRNSTSNHNLHVRACCTLHVVSYRNSTSNHNYINPLSWQYLLYLIEIPHQTTTCDSRLFNVSRLYLIEIPHQTTTSGAFFSQAYGCILSKFHIKPQLLEICSKSSIVVSYRNSTSNHNHIVWRTFVELVVSYRNSTSNHNLQIPRRSPRLLYLIEIPHQTTTSSPA